MKKTIIVLSGNAYQGKSDTIKRTTKKILSNYPNAFSNLKALDDSPEVKLTLIIQNRFVCIESQGDPKSRLSCSLQGFANIEADIIICATRNYGAAIHAIEALQQTHGYDVIWATNYQSNEKNHDSLNEISSGQIFELFQNIFSGKL